MVETNRYKMKAKTIANRRLPIPKKGDFRPAGPVAFE